MNRLSPPSIMTDRVAWRLSFYFAALFAVFGVQLPFWPVYLQEAKALTAADIGLVLSAGLWIKVLFNPLVGQWADRHGERRRPMMLLCLLALVAFAGFIFAEGFWTLFALALLAGVSLAAVMPLGESVALDVVYRRGLDYGRVRLWGSISFIAVAVVVGPLLARVGPDVILVATILLMLATLLACWMMPSARPPRAEPGQAPLRRLLLNPRFVLFLGAVALSQSSHGVLYGFGTLHWRAHDISDNIIGGLWAEGVIAEIIVFTLGGLLLRRIGVTGLIALGAAAGVVRWLAYGYTTELPVLLVMQLLHGFTFGANHLGAMHFIARAVPGGWSTSAQGLYTAISGGLALGLAILVGGVLYEWIGGAAFYVAAGQAALGLVLALVLWRQWDGGLISR